MQLPSVRSRGGVVPALLVAFALSACAPDASSARTEAGRVGDAQATPAHTAAASPGAERSARRVILNGVDLTGVGYDRGSPTAPVVMVDFSDFGCPYCGKHSRETLPALEREFIETGKVFYKYVPIVMGFPNGDHGARAAECAAEQGRFWAMHDRLYVGQQDWRKSSQPAPIYLEYARELGLDAAGFTSCLADGRTETRTQQATGIARALGIRATPTFAMDGEGIEGALPLDVFQKLLREKLAR